MITMSNQQARQFILLKQGLLGEYRFKGKSGALDYIRQAGCIQYDPVDVCGRNADITLHARVKAYTKAILDELLYTDRRLIDHFDKNLSIFAIEDIPAVFFRKPGSGYAQAYDNRGGEAVKQTEPLIRQLITERGHVSAAEVNVDDSIEWFWGIMTSLPRAALESMYFRGELIIHHKNGTNKSYAFMKDHIPPEILSAPPPFASYEECLAWHIRRRVGAVGMLWNKSSDAFLGLSIKAPERDAAYQRLIDSGAVFEVTVEGLKLQLYIREDDRALLETVLSAKEYPPRCELIAPLDSFIWDRKLIKTLFGFEYTWEIYTPAVKRKYGAYVLPILYGERLIGRVEAVCERKTKTLAVKNVWYEDGVKQTKKLGAALDGCLKRFAEFNGCVGVDNNC